MLATVCVVSDIWSHAQLWAQSAPLPVPLLGGVPRLWLLLAANVLTQYVCVRGVYSLTSQSRLPPVRRRASRADAALLCQAWRRR